MRKAVVLSAVVLLFAASGGWYYWTQAKAEAEHQILETAVVSRGTVRSVLEATGIVKPEVGAIVKTGTRATGLIRKMYVRVGDSVTQGTLIAEIDDREQQASLAEAEAQLKRAEAEAARVQTVFPLQIKEAEAQLDAAKAEADYLALTMKRQKKLVTQNLDSQDSLDDASQQYTIAKNTLKARNATLKRLRTEYRLETIKAKEDLAAAQAELESTKVRITYTTIHAPIDGIVSQVAAQEGETVVAGLEVANLITILDPSRLEMWIYIDETDVGQVRPEMTVEFRVDAYPDTLFYGTVDQIYPQPEIRDNIVYYQALVRLEPATSQQLRPEMTTQCSVVVEEKKEVLALPNEALKWVDGKQYVFVQDADGKTTSVEPVLGLSGINYSELLEGVAEGATVATKLVLASRKKGK